MKWIFAWESGEREACTREGFIQEEVAEITGFS